MITVVIDYINELIFQNFRFFSKRHGLVQQLQIFGEEADITFPAIYDSAGDSDHINFDFSNATVYHRQIGDQTEAEDIEQATVGSEEFIIQTTPMRMVAYFNKDVYNTDNKSIALKVAQNLRSVMRAPNIKVLSTALDADYTSVNIDGIKTDPYEIWEEEYEGVKFAVPSTHALIAIDYTIEIGINNECLIAYGCGDTDIIISSGVIETETEITATTGTLIYNATLPAVGQPIIDVDGVNIGTLLSLSQIYIPGLDSYSLKNFFVKVDELWLKWLNSDDLLNDIDDSTSSGGTITLFTGHDLFQPGAELRIWVKT